MGALVDISPLFAIAAAAGAFVMEVFGEDGHLSNPLELGTGF